jgi:hypothetical protein
MYLGELAVGAIFLHAQWGIGRVRRRDETCVIGQFGTHRRKLAYNDRVAVWAIEQAGAQANTQAMGRAA